VIQGLLFPSAIWNTCSVGSLGVDNGWCAKVLRREYGGSSLPEMSERRPPGLEDRLYCGGEEMSIGGGGGDDGMWAKVWDYIGHNDKGTSYCGCQKRTSKFGTNG